MDHPVVRAFLPDTLVEQPLKIPRVTWVNAIGIAIFHAIGLGRRDKHATRAVHPQLLPQIMSNALLIRENQPLRRRIGARSEKPRGRRPPVSAVQQPTGRGWKVSQDGFATGGPRLQADEFHQNLPSLIT